CQAMGLDLAMVDDADENAFLRSSVQTDSYIGLTDGAKEGSFRWLVDGSLSYCGDSSGRAPSSESFTSWSSHFPAVVARCRLETRSNRSYWFCDDSRSFDSARAACESVGMKLARVDESTEDAFIRSKISRDSWIGATDLVVPGDWRWLDGDALF